MLENKKLRIALYGLGSAGRSRQRACDEVEGVELAALVSRRPELATASLESALQDASIAAIAVSTENTSHALAVRLSLEAGKHVLCDYPVALSGSEARDLYRLAKERKLVLHTEHIALLSNEHQSLKEEVLKAGPLKRGEYLFQGGWNEKLADTDYTGPYPFLAVSRLVQIADLFGPFQIVSHRSEIKLQGYSLHLHLKFTNGGILGFTEERLVGLPRRRSLTAECENGAVTLKAGTMGGGLFAKDLAWFRDRVLDGKHCYYDEEVMIQILEKLSAL